jgi:hypothetical protein
MAPGVVGRLGRSVAISPSSSPYPGEDRLALADADLLFSATIATSLTPRNDSAIDVILNSFSGSNVPAERFAALAAIDCDTLSPIEFSFSLC